MAVTAQVRRSVKFSASFRQEVGLPAKLPGSLGSTHTHGVGMIPDLDQLVQADCGAGLLPAVAARFVLVGDYINHYHTPSKRAAVVPMIVRGNTLHIEMPDGAMFLDKFQKHSPEREKQAVTEVFKTAVSAGACFREAWRPFLEDSPKGLYFGESYHEGPDRFRQLRDTFPDVYVQLNREVSTSAMISGMELEDGETGERLLPLPLMTAFIDAVDDGLPVLAPVAGIFQGVVAAPKGVSRPDKRLAYFAVEASDGRLHYVAAVRGAEMSADIGDMVVAGRPLGYALGYMPQSWRGLGCVYRQWDALPGHGVNEVTRGLLLDRWLESQTLRMAGQVLWPYHVVAGALTHPDFSDTSITDVFLDVRDTSCWNDSREMFVFPAAPKHHARDLSKDIKSVQVKFAVR